MTPRYDPDARQYLRRYLTTFNVIFFNLKFLGHFKTDFVVFSSRSSSQNEDEKAREKRERNRRAAAKCREKKVKKIESLGKKASNQPISRHRNMLKKCTR